LKEKCASDINASATRAMKRVMKVDDKMPPDHESARAVPELRALAHRHCDRTQCKLALHNRSSGAAAT